MTTPLILDNNEIEQNIIFNNEASDDDNEIDDSKIKKSIIRIEMEIKRNEKFEQKNINKNLSDIYVKKWVDYSSKYGLGYILSNGHVGVNFNDSTKIMYRPNG